MPQNHPKKPKIQEDFNRALAGFHGEVAINYPLDELPENAYHIFHGIRLLLNSHYFQIDCLLISLYFILILEVKNYAGTVIFDSDTEQLNRINTDGTEEILPNPIPQVRRQKILLQNWMREHNQTELPIETLGVFSNPYTKIKSLQNDPTVYQAVCSISSLLHKIEQKGNMFRESKLNTKDLKKLDKILLKSHHPEFPNLLKKYLIDPSELLTGVQCPDLACSTILLQYNRGKWYCPNCKKSYKGIHNHALNDYFLLVKQTITCSELRRFLHIKSENISTKLLLSLNFPSKGETKGRIYHVPKDYDFHKYCGN